MNDRLRAATLSNDNYNWPASRYNTVLPYRNAHSNPTPDSMQNGFIIDRGFIDPSGPMTYRLNLFEKDRFESRAIFARGIKNGKNGNNWRKSLSDWACMVIVFFFFSFFFFFRVYYVNEIMEVIIIINVSMWK